MVEARSREGIDRGESGGPLTQRLNADHSLFAEEPGRAGLSVSIKKDRR
ncbi:hypothetical protein [Hydrocarboniclastica marina]|nr:hypothetical protein [Hydrocarboniclastica marina]